MIYYFNIPVFLILQLQHFINEIYFQSNEEKERLDVTKVLGRMFSDKNSTMIEENKNLWNCFLTRYLFSQI